jgi:hypothetical protein
MPAEVKEKQQIDRMEQSLSGVSARFDELTARFESSINSLQEVLRTHSADLNAHNDQYNSRFAQIERAFEATQQMINQQSVRLTALEQTAGWVSSIMTSVTQSAPTAGTGAPKSTGGVAYVGTASTGGTGGGNSAGTATSTGSGTATSTSDTATKASAAAADTATVSEPKLQYPDVANASSYVGASLQAGGAMIAAPTLATGWTQALAFAPAAVGLVDDMAADVDNKLALKRAATSAIAGGALLLLAKAMK